MMKPLFAIVYVAAFGKSGHNYSYVYTYTYNYIATYLEFKMD